MTMHTILPRLTHGALLGALCLPACAAEPDGVDTDAATSGADAETTSGTDPTAATTTESTTTATTSTTTSTGTTDTGDPDVGESSGGTDEPGPDLRERGPHRVETTPGSVPIDGCTMTYDVFAPVGVADAPTVVLAHGFQGNRGSMAGWADHWASWGLRVVTPDLCHATIIDPDHAQNGVDLVALVEHLDAGPVALAGYSAGGLAAVLAASMLPDTTTLLGLDMVDNGGLGADVAAAVTAPTHGITAETAMCNSSSNGVPVFAAIGGSTTVRVIEADHCDFQNPGDMFCGLCAAANETHTPEAIRAAILGLSTSALLWRLDVEATGAQWWTPGGPYYDELFGAGSIAQL